MRVSTVMVLMLAAVLVIGTASMAGDKDKEKGPKAVTISGKLTKVEDAAITVTVTKGKEKERVEEAKTIAVDKDTTKVSIETDEMENVPGEGGKNKQRPKVVDGTLADLSQKIGQRVTVTCSEDGTKALKVLVHRAALPKKGKEGGKEGGGGGGAPGRGKPKEGDKKG